MVFVFWCLAFCRCLSAIRSFSTKGHYSCQQPSCNNLAAQPGLQCSHWPMPAIKAENKFVEVMFQVLGINAVVGALEPRRGRRPRTTPAREYDSDATTCPPLGKSVSRTLDTPKHGVPRGAKPSECHTVDTESPPATDFPTNNSVSFIAGLSYLRVPPPSARAGALGALPRGKSVTQRAGRPAAAKAKKGPGGCSGPCELQLRRCLRPLESETRRLPGARRGYRDLVLRSELDWPHHTEAERRFGRAAVKSACVG
jgi:hypothetical protein